MQRSASVSAPGGRRVRFRASVDVKLVKTVGEMTKEEIDAVWYSAADSRRVKKDARAVVRFMVLLDRRKSCSDTAVTSSQLELGRKLCTRGLEYLLLTPETMEKRAAEKKSVISAVLEEQSRQRVKRRLRFSSLSTTSLLDSADMTAAMENEAEAIRCVSWERSSMERERRMERANTDALEAERICLDLIPRWRRSSSTCSNKKNDQRETQPICCGDAAADAAAAVEEVENSKSRRKSCADIMREALILTGRVIDADPIMRQDCKKGAPTRGVVEVSQSLSACYGHCSAEAPAGRESCSKKRENGGGSFSTRQCSSPLMTKSKKAETKMMTSIESPKQSLSDLVGKGVMFESPSRVLRYA